MSQPYRSFELCERMKDQHGSVATVQVLRKNAWRWGPFTGGRIIWGVKHYKVFATPWFSIWWG